LRVFDDPYIQNLNPFDEGFRKAISEDHQHAGFLTTPSSNQDTLHTPQIIPDFISRVIKEEKLKHEVLLPIQDEPENLSTTPDIPKYSITDQHEHHTIERTQQQPIPLLPKPNIIYAAPILTSAAPMHLNDSGKSSESVKDKLKNIILNNNTTGTATITDGSKRIKMESESKLNLPAILIQTVPLITPANFIINNNNNDDDSKLRVTSSNNGNSNSIKLKPLEIKKPEREISTKKRTVTANSDSSNNSNTKPDSNALKVERNRAAARRYRNKMKIQSQALREKYDRSQKEISQLKKEVTELKKLLLLHKDCEVTKSLSRMS
jgi:hypothetical protein